MNKATYQVNGIIKNTILLLLFLSGIKGYADNEKHTVINYVWLANNTNYSGFTRPGKLPIGLNAVRQAYYKIIDSREAVIKAGLLSQGSNIIEITDQTLFKKSQTHTYTLFLKTGDRVVKKRIEIDIHFDNPENLEHMEKEKPEPKQAEPAGGKKKQPAKIPGKGEYSVSMFIEEQFILKEDKSHTRQIVIETRKGPPGDFGRPSHIDGSYPALQSGGIPVLPLFMMLLKKTVLKKPVKEKKRLAPLQQLALKFMEKNNRGKEQLISMRLGIKMSDIN